jgi:hypothetical protein
VKSSNGNGGGFKVAMRPITQVTPYARNPRKNAGAVAKVAGSIKEFGFRQPIVVDEDGVIITGHTRLLAALHLGLSEVPVHVAVGLTPAQAKAYRIADNRVSEEAEWNEELLALEMTDLRALDFDTGLTGFEGDEIAQLLKQSGQSGGEYTEGDTPEPPAEPLTNEGEIIQVGRHRLMCGDSRDWEQVDRLIAGDRPQMACNDPPYGVSIVRGGWVGGGESNNIPFGGVPKGETDLQRKARLGTVGGSKPFGSKDVRGTDGASNIVEANRYAPVIGDESIDTAVAAAKLCADLKIPRQVFWGANHYAAEAGFPSSPCWLIWDKENTGNFADAELAWTNADKAVRIFRHMWNGMLRASERGRRLHPTQKPVALAIWCYDLLGQPGDVVLDLFGGAGWTLLAAEARDRTALVMEMSPAYCDVMVTRWETMTGQKAVRP